jgi:hypothetical protein
VGLLSLFGHPYFNGVRLNCSNQFLTMGKYSVTGWFLQAKNVEIDAHDLIVFEVLIVPALVVPQSVPPAQQEQAKPISGCWNLLIALAFLKEAIPAFCETGFHDCGVNCAAHRLYQSGRKSGGRENGRCETLHVDPIRAIPFPAFDPKFDSQTESRFTATWRRRRPGAFNCYE